MTTTTQVMTTPVPTEESDLIVSRRNLLDPGYTSTARLINSDAGAIWLLIASINNNAGKSAISPK
jgi:hypothetical protein